MEKTKVRSIKVTALILLISLLFSACGIDITNVFTPSGPFVEYSVSELDGGMSSDEFETVTVRIAANGEGTYNIYNHETGRNYAVAFQIDDAIVQSIQNDIIRSNFTALDEDLSVTDSFHGSEEKLTVYYCIGYHTSGGVNPDNKQFKMVRDAVLASVPEDIADSANEIKDKFSIGNGLVLTIPEQLAQSDIITDTGFYAIDKDEILYFVSYSDMSSLKNGDSVSVSFSNIEKTIKSDESHSMPQPAYTVVATSISKRSAVMDSEVSYPYELACRNNLAVEEQNLYDWYLPKLQNKEPIQLDVHSIETAEQAINIQEVLIAIVRDNPEIESYFNPYKSIFENDGLLLYQCQWGQNSCLDEDINAGIDEMRQAADNIIDKMPQDLSTYDKYVFLAKELCEITQYDDDITDVGRLAYGALVNGKSSCQGYTFAYQYLCMQAGLWCTKVNSESHAWNLIKLETGTYHVDVTWADSFEPYSAEWFEYICMSQQEAASLEAHVTTDGTVADGIAFTRQ